MPRDRDSLLSLVTVQIVVPGSHKGQERSRICYFHGAAAVDAVGSISDGRRRLEELSPRRNRGDGDMPPSPHLTGLSCH